MYGIVVFIVCCHFVSLYYLPWEGPLLLLQAVQKALSRLILSFCKDNHFFLRIYPFSAVFSLFSLPWFSHSLPCLSHSLPWLSHSLPLRNLRENIIKKYRIPIEKAFTFWAFLSQRVHHFTPFVTFWWIPVKGGFTPWIPSVYRTSGADVKGEPSFLALYACAKRNKIKKENSSMGNAIKTYKRIYIYYYRRSQCHSAVSPDRLFRPAND